MERGGRAIFLAVLAREGSLLYCNHRYLFSATDGYHGLLRPSSRRSRNYTHTNGRTAHGTQQATYRHAGQSVRGSSRRGSTCETAKIMSIVVRLDNEELVLRFGRSETAERALVRAQLPQQRAPSPASTCETRAWPLSVVDVWAGEVEARGLACNGSTVSGHGSRAVDLAAGLARLGACGLATRVAAGASLTIRN